MATADTAFDKQTQTIALLSGENNLQTSVLASLIAQELALHCKVFVDLASVPDAVDLLLIDCHGQDIESLTDIAKEVHNHPSNAAAALLNAEHESEHENLLDWPCLAGLFYRDTDQEQLLRGLQVLLDGDYWMPRRLLHHFLEKNRKTPVASNQSNVNLTKRERQILTLIHDGATNADIADTLNVSEHTVKSHLYNVYKKIGVRNRLEASNWVRGMPEFG